MQPKKTNSFMQGVAYLLGGYQDIFSPQLRKYIIIPLLINLCVFGVLFYFGMTYLWQKISFLSPDHLPYGLQWLHGILKTLKIFLITTVASLFAVGFAMFSTLISNFMSAPFNGFLSEAASLAKGEALLPTRSLLHNTVNVLHRESTKFVHYLPGGIGIGILGVCFYFIPPLNLLTPILFYGYSAWVMAIQYLDYPADNHHISFKALLKLMKRERLVVLGFGLTVAVFSSIPIVNFLVMPAAVIGATRLWHDNFAPKTKNILISAIKSTQQPH